MSACGILPECFFQTPPSLTEHNLPDQRGRVHMVTGGYAGIGYEMTKILYAHNATVYVAGRSPDKAHKALADIRAAHPKSMGKLVFLHIDLLDLRTIKPAVDRFLQQETRLDVLTNNAGVMLLHPTLDEYSGRETQMTTNCLAPFLLTKLLLPILQRTAAQSPPNSVRVTFAGSVAMYYAPGDGVVFDADGNVDHMMHPIGKAYAQTKACNLMLVSELDRHLQEQHQSSEEHKESKTSSTSTLANYDHDKSSSTSSSTNAIVSLCWNPGNLATDWGRHDAPTLNRLLNTVFAHPRFGAYTVLYAALSPDITTAHNGSYIIPWGRVAEPPGFIARSCKSRQEGGTGLARQFWEWCERQTAAFA